MTSGLFDIVENGDGLTINLSLRHLYIFDQMLMRVKFPQDYVFSTTELLNPFVNQLIEAVHTQIYKANPGQVNKVIFPQSGPLAQAVFAAIDQHIERNGLPIDARDDLLKTAFLPFHVEGFE